MQRKGTILVIDDEAVMREILETLLTREGYDVRLTSNGEQGLELARALPFDAAVVDVMMPGLNGIQTLEELKKLDEDLPVVMITAFASVESAIAAMKRGAFHYVTKPFKNDEVLAVLHNALDRRRLLIENRALRQSLQSQQHRFAGIIGRSSAMRQVFDLIIQAAPSRSTILIEGESGYRQGARGACASRQLIACRPAVRVGELGQSAARSPGIESVRPRQGRVHGRHPAEEGVVRARHHGHDLLR